MTRIPVADAFALVIDAPIRFVAYDGSAAGDPDAPVKLVIKSPRAVAHLVSAPGELGLARAYVSGELDLDGTDHYTALAALASGHSIGSLSWRDRLTVLSSLGPAAIRYVEPPPQEVGARRLLAGLRHSRGRDAVAIKHHYDVSNRFYQWVLGPSMVYTCAVFPTDETTLEEAQTEKIDLVCRKLALRPGMRLLDVGCGWGGLVVHAVKNYGVTALGVTLSRQQAEWGQSWIEELGLDGAQVRHSDYRDVTETGFDAISSIGLTEHIGEANVDAYAADLTSRLAPGGRLLNHCITRPDEDSPKIARRGFTNRYVFPDGELLGPGRVIAALERAGLEMRHEENLREHYARTLAGWCANLDAHWDEAVAEVGLGTARVWALYLAGSQLGFERNHTQLHQVLTVKPHEGGISGMPARPDWRP
ncbi:MAG: class I SAM-dependent methyltransferase [Frankia sp.]